jgi:hypothetical protein
MFLRRGRERDDGDKRRLLALVSLGEVQRDAGADVQPVPARDAVPDRLMLAFVLALQHAAQVPLPTFYPVAATPIATRPAPSPNPTMAALLQRLLVRPTPGTATTPGIRRTPRPIPTLAPIVFRTVATTPIPTVRPRPTAPRTTPTPRITPTPRGTPRGGPPH